MGDEAPHRSMVALPIRNPPALEALLKHPPRPGPPPLLPGILKNSRTQHLTKAMLKWANENPTEVQFERQERFQFHIDNLNAETIGIEYLPHNYIPGWLPQEQGETEAMRLHLIDKHLTQARHIYDSTLKEFNLRLEKWIKEGGNINNLCTGHSLPGRTLRSRSPDLYNGAGGYGPEPHYWRKLDPNMNEMEYALKRLAFENEKPSYNIDFMSLSPQKEPRNDWNNIVPPKWRERSTSAFIDEISPDYDSSSESSENYDIFSRDHYNLFPGFFGAISEQDGEGAIVECSALRLQFCYEWNKNRGIFRTEAAPQHIHHAMVQKVGGNKKRNLDSLSSSRSVDTQYPTKTRRLNSGTLKPLFYDVLGMSQGRSL